MKIIIFLLLYLIALIGIMFLHYITNDRKHKNIVELINDTPLFAFIPVFNIVLLIVLSIVLLCTFVYYRTDIEGWIEKLCNSIKNIKL